MNRIASALLASTGLCGLGWLIGTDDVRGIAAVGTLCVAVTCLCFLWSCELRRLLGRSRDGHEDSPSSARSPSMLALIAAIMIIGLLARAASNGEPSFMRGVFLLCAVAIASTILMRSRTWRVVGRGDPPTPMRSSPPEVPDKVPVEPVCERHGDLGKTRPMPRR